MISNNPKGRYMAPRTYKTSMFKHPTANRGNSCDCKYCSCNNTESCLKNNHTCCIGRTPSISEKGMTYYHR